MPVPPGCRSASSSAAAAVDRLKPNERDADGAWDRLDDCLQRARFVQRRSRARCETSRAGGRTSAYVLGPDGCPTDRTAGATTSRWRHGMTRMRCGSARGISASDGQSVARRAPRVRARAHAPERARQRHDDPDVFEQRLHHWIERSSRVEIGRRRRDEVQVPHTDRLIIGSGAQHLLIEIVEKRQIESVDVEKTDSAAEHVVVPLRRRQIAGQEVRARARPTPRP